MDLEMIKEIAVPILRRHGVAKASVFGSYAKGDYDKNSDVDILIEYAPGVRKSLFTRIKIKNELKRALQKDVDVVTEASLSQHLRDEVMREGRTIM
ncbi:MAG: nucleotidyltransferase family protein [Peptococcaceae bacterium]|nr:nucleotidyltransferase family protein [Peptococcaceae bacterium]